MAILHLIKPYLLAVAFVLFGAIGGILLNKIVLNHLEKLTSKTKWQVDDIIISLLKKYGRLWIFLAGVFLAIDTGVFPESITDPVHKILLVIIVLSFAFALSGFFAQLIAIYAEKVGSKIHSTDFIVNLLRGIIISIGIMMLLQTFGISITPLLGALGVGSMAAGFALKDTLANFFAGAQILMTQQLHRGDFVQLSSGMEGTITDITLRNTTLLSRSNNTIVVPNAELAIAIILNYSIPMPNIRVKVDCGVAYDSDLELVEKIALESAQEIMETVNGGVPTFKVGFRFHTFNNSSIDFTTIMQALDFPAQHRVRHEFIKLLKKRFDENGIEIPFPIRTIVQEHPDN